MYMIRLADGRWLGGENGWYVAKDSPEGAFIYKSKEECDQIIGSYLWYESDLGEGNYQNAEVYELTIRK